jgi:hypothetical protein
VGAGKGIYVEPDPKDSALLQNNMETTGLRDLSIRRWNHGPVRHSCIKLKQSSRLAMHLITYDRI